MTRSKVAIVGLLVALVGSNAWWVYSSIDRGISLTYLQASFDSNTQLMNQALAVLREVLASNASREQVVRAAQLGQADNQAFEKQGYVWVGQLGFKFDGQGKLARVATSEEEAR